MFCFPLCSMLLLRLSEFLFVILISVIRIGLSLSSFCEQTGGLVVWIWAGF